jgi:hypothetical protein
MKAPIANLDSRRTGINSPPKVHEFEGHSYSSGFADLALQATPALPSEEFIQEVQNMERRYTYQQEGG